MERMWKPSEKDDLVDSFLDVAAGQTVDAATHYLQATGWQLDCLRMLSSCSSSGMRVEERDHGRLLLCRGITPGDASDSAVADGQVGGGEVGDDGARPSLPVRREVLYDDAYRLHTSSVDFRNFNVETKHLGVWESGRSAASSPDSSRHNLASLYLPPFALMYTGSFDKAKFEAYLQDKWLLVNLQSTDEFSSHLLNCDTWSNEAVAQTILANFIFWQVSHDTSEGKKVCNYYNLVNMPAILIIDPITGQRIRAWHGMVQPDRLLEDLLPFMDRGPQEHNVVLPHESPRDSAQSSRRILHKCPRDSAHSSRRISTDKTPEEVSENIFQAATPSVTDSNIAQSGGISDEEAKNDEVAATSSDVKPAYPPLSEEPTGDRQIICKVRIRLPDGRRIQRNFLRMDPIQLLWSFCTSQLGEGEKRPFHFTQAIPGVSRMINYGNKLTFAESGLSDSMISLTWE